MRRFDKVKVEVNKDFSKGKDKWRVKARQLLDKVRVVRGAQKREGG